MPGLAARVPSWWVLSVLVGAYAGLACLSMGVSRQPGQIATVWYANAAAVVLLARAPRWQWPVMLGVVAMVNAAVNRLWGDAPLSILAFLPPNLLEILLGAWALQRAGLATSALRSPAALLRLLLLGGVLPQAAAAGLAALSFGLLGREAAALLGLAWFESTVIGAISVLPAGLLLANQSPQRLRQALGDRRLGLLAPLAVTSSLLCLGWMPYPFVFLAMPLLAAAILLDMVAVALLTALVSVTVALGLAAGVFVPPAAVAYGQAGFITLAFAAALVPALLLAAAVAELRDHQGRLMERKAELRAAHAALQQFVHIASHDLREPLNTITQFSGLLAQDHAAALPSEAAQYLALVRQAADRMRLLLDDVLQYSQVQQGELPAPQPVALDAVLEQVRQALAPRLTESGAQLRWVPLPVVWGHASLLVLLLHNLLDNALKFVAPGQVPDVQIEARQTPGEVWLTVADRGIGIALAQQARLFTPFQRLHLRRDYDGTGLGLALCRQIARAHGGDIELQSAPGEGTRLTVRLPLWSGTAGRPRG